MHAHARSLVVSLISAFVFCLVALSPKSAEAAITVTTTANSGAGSLRQAITTANSSSGPDIIQFAIGAGSATQTVIVTGSALPIITEEVVFDGSTNSGFIAMPERPIVYIQNQSGLPMYGLHCQAKCTIRSLAIGGFDASATSTGVYLDVGSDNSIIEGSVIGAGYTSLWGLDPNAIGLYVDAPGVTIGGGTTSTQNQFAFNNFSSSGTHIWLTQNADNAVIAGNLIGSNQTGASIIDSQTKYGIFLNGPSNVRIGGTAFGERNIIMALVGSTRSAVRAIFVDNLDIFGNLINISASGTNYGFAYGVTGNLGGGAIFVSSSTNIEIGSATNAYLQQIIGGGTSNSLTFANSTGVSIVNTSFGLNGIGSSNLGDGSIALSAVTSVAIGTQTSRVYLTEGVTSTQSSAVDIQNTWIGVSVTGTGIASTGSIGFRFSTSTDIFVGGDEEAERNYIFRCNVNCVTFEGVSLSEVSGNTFGFSQAGLDGTIQRGIQLMNSTSVNIGTGLTKQYISNTTGVIAAGIEGTRVNGVTIKNNRIGTSLDGFTAKTMSYPLSFWSSSGVTVGGLLPNEGNQLVGSTYNAELTAVTSTKFYQNLIGTNASTSADISTASWGIRMTGATDTLIGLPGLGNYISDSVSQFGYSSTSFYGNYLGINATGTARIGTNGDPAQVYLRDGRYLNFGGSQPGESNVITGITNSLFLDSTVYLDRPLNAIIKGNAFGFNASGTQTYRVNTDSIFIDQGYTDVQIGGSAAGEANSFGWANFSNIELWRNRNITVQGNYFGYTASSSLFSGTRHGVYQWETTSTVIGGFNAGESNYFGTSSQSMIDLERSTSTRVYGNYFGVTTSGRMLVGTSSQIYVGFNMYDLQVGGTTLGMGNIVTNAAYGIYHENSINTGIYGNTFGMSPTTTAGYGFTLDAIFVGAGSTSTSIGDGTMPGANSIGGSGFAGIELFQATSTQVLGNYFGTNTTTVAVVPNDNDIYIEQGYNTIIGGSVAGQGNIFAYTNSDSLVIANLARLTTVKGNTFGATESHVMALPINAVNGAAIYLTGANASNTVIGGMGVGEGNWLSNGRIGIQMDGHGGIMSILGNTMVSSSLYGLYVSANNGTTTAQGNYIGIDAAMIFRPNAIGALIGGTNAGYLILGGSNGTEENLISGNTNQGLVVAPGASNIYLLRNRIYGNGGLQVDLGNDGPTPNDANDADAGANSLLNYPIPLGVNGMFAGYAYAGLASQQVVMDVYFSSSTDSFGRGQLMQYATTVTFTTDGSGLASGFVDVASYGHDGVDKVAFLAHNASNTSEMSGATGGLLGIALAASSTDNFDNTSDVEFTYTLVNYGSDSLTNLQLEFSRALFFPLVSGITIVAAPTTAYPTITIDGAFDGDADTTMFNAGASTLTGNTTATISFIINVPHSGTGLFSGYATTSGDVLGFSLQDVSVSGTVPDIGNGISYDGDLDPTNNTLITTLNLPTYTPPTPEVSFVLDAQTISETAGTATVNIILNAATSATDIVATYSIGGTASDPADFLTPSGSFTILAGESSTSVQVTLVNDATVEVDKTIILALTSVTPNATSGATTTHTITLQSEDAPPPPELEFSAFTSNVNEGDGVVTVELELSGTDASDVDFSYSVSGTAETPADFGALSGSGSVLAGDTTTTISITLADDGFYESAETIVLNLEFISTNAASGTRMQHTMTVADNDVQPVVSFAVTSSSGLEAGLGSVAIEVVMDATSSLPVGIEYLIGGSALMGSDIGTLSGYAEISPLATSTTITINVADDFDVEVDENVTLTLSSVSSHAMIGATSSYELIIQNDDAAVPPAPVVTGGGALSCNQLSGGCGGAVLPVAVTSTTTTSTTNDIVQPEPVTPVSNNEDNGPIMSIDPGSVNACMKEVAGICTPYLKSFIRYGSTNDPEEVKKLQVFLRDVMGMKEVKITGIYDLVSLRAVMKFQAGLGKDVLSPWNLSSPTGYVYITTSRAINRLHCQKNPPKPQIVNICDTSCLKKIQNSEGKDTYIDVCKKTISCMPLLSKTVAYGSRTNSAIEVERLQVAINVALGRSKKPTRIFDLATRNDVNTLVKAYFPEVKANLSLVGGKPGMLGDKMQALLNATWCEK